MAGNYRSIVALRRWFIGETRNLTDVMALMPFIKLITTLVRSLVFIAVLMVSEEKQGSADLLAFLSFVTIGGICIGFGAVDSFVKLNTEMYTRVRLIFLTLVSCAAFSIALVLLKLQIVNIVVSSLCFGLSFWSLGVIRRFSPVTYEMSVCFQMLILWIAYLLFIAIEDTVYTLLTILFYCSFVGLTFVAFVVQRLAVNQSKDLTGKFLQTSASKLAWEVVYTGWTRNIFMVWNSFSVIPSILSYVYYACELFSAMVSQYQTIFLVSNDPKKNAASFFSLLRKAVIAYLFLGAVILLLYFFQVEFKKIISEIFSFYDRQLDIFLFDSVAMTLCIVLILNIFFIQVLAYARYALHWQDRLDFVLICGAILVSNLVVGVFLFGQYGLHGALVANLLMCICGGITATVLIHKKVRGVQVHKQF